MNMPGTPVPFTNRPISFTVPGEPHGMGRPRFTIRPGKGGGRGFVQAYTPAASREYKNLIGLFARSNRPERPWDGPIRLDVVAYLERPQRLLKKSSPSGVIWCTTKPDRDNIDKAVMDALTEARYWIDDKQVCAGGVAKCFVAIGCQPGLFVRVSQLDDHAVERSLFQPIPQEVSQ